MDRLAPAAIARWILPHQRVLALAAQAGGDPAHLAEALGLDLVSTRRLDAALAQRAARQVRYEAAAGRWSEAFFDAGPGVIGGDRLVALERERRAAAVASTSGGGAFLRLARRSDALAWDVPGPNPVAPEPVPAMIEASLAAVERSRSLGSSHGRESWIRFAAPVLCDLAWARLYEPEDGAARGTVILLHGIAMETEFWRDTEDPINALTRAGLRVLRPEGPWHGRRRLPGHFGGEPALARAPLGLVALIEAWTEEVRVMTAWCRGRLGGPVALAGLSLGALAAQWMAVAARGWPAAERPDLLFLVVTSGGLVDLAAHSALAHALGIPARIARAGWDEAALDRLVRRVEPAEAPAMGPGRVVMLLGSRDEVTPFAGGLALARRWALPVENLFVRPYGHFSAALRLGRDPAPLRRLVRLFDSF